jgi:hypothetical protein
MSETFFQCLAAIIVYALFIAAIITKNVEREKP